MTTRSQWASLFLQRCGFKVTRENVVAIMAWAASEGSRALANPLDTTELWAGSTDYNSAGVKNYASLTDGLDATKRTLFNGRYGPVVSALEISNDANTICRRVAGSPWGSHPSDSLVNNVRNAPQRYDTEVPGTPAPEPHPAPGPAPAPPVTTSQTQLEGNIEMATRILVTMPVLDGDGCGAVILDGGAGTVPGIESVTPAVDINKVLAVGAWGSDPSASADKTYWKHTASFQDRGGHPLVTIVNGVPHGSASAYVTVAD